MKKISVKVCGMKDRENINSLTTLCPDFIGLIFYEGSKRFVGHMFDPDVLNSITGRIEKVGVFVNADKGQILDKVNSYDLDLVQLHGDESVGYCKELRAMGLKIIKAFALHDDFDFEMLHEYQHDVDFFLFDTRGTNFGGNGITFNWEVLKNYKLEVPFFLSGGIGPEHASAIKTIQHDQLYAIDLNSKFERDPGYKNIEKLNVFLKQLKA